MTGSVSNRFFEDCRAGSHLHGNISFSGRFAFERRIVPSADFYESPQVCFDLTKNFDLNSLNFFSGVAISLPHSPLAQKPHVCSIAQIRNGGVAGTDSH
jgi:hypothetical protein